MRTKRFDAGFQSGCHPGQARSAPIRDRRVNASASGGPGSSLRCAGMTIGKSGGMSYRSWSVERIRISLIVTWAGRETA